VTLSAAKAKVGQKSFMNVFGGLNFYIFIHFGIYFILARFAYNLS